MRLHWPMWHIAFTRHFMEDFEGHWESLIPYYMRHTYHDYDRDWYHWHHKWIAPFMKFWYKWRWVRWIPGRVLYAFLNDRDHI